MAGKTYSAGTIFLQVVPVFNDTMHTIRREAQDLNKALSKDLGDTIEKGAADAGKRGGKALADNMGDAGKESAEKYLGEFDTRLRSGLARTQRELKPLRQQIVVEDDQVRETFKQIDERVAALIKQLRGKKILKIEATQAYNELKRLNMQMDLLAESAKSDRIRKNLQAASKGVGSFVKSIQDANPKLREALSLDKVEEEWSHFDKTVQKHLKNITKAIGNSISPELRKIKKEMEDLSTLRVNVDIDEQALKERLSMLRGRLQAAGAQAAMPGPASSNVDVQNVGMSLAQLDMLDKEMDKIDGRTLRARIEIHGRDAMREMGVMTALMRSFTDEGKRASQAHRDNGNAFRAFNVVILTATTLLPGLIPLVAGLTGALISLGPALAGVGAGLGVMLLGFSGIGDAVKALGDVEKSAAKDTEAASRTMRDASNAIEDAERGLTRAREDSAEMAEDAARRVARAQQDAARAVEDALDRQKEAEERLTDAQRDATQAQEELREARRLAQQDLDDVADRARQNALDERQAVIDLFNARVAYDATMRSGASTNLEREQSSINLEEAKLRLEEIREEEKALAGEQRKASEEGVEGTERVQTARENLRSAMDAELDAQEALREAAADVVRARVDGAEQVADAVRAQQRAEEDGAERISDAQRTLVRAQESYQDALTDTAEVGSSSMQALEEAMAKLSPAGRDFARYLYSLRREFLLLRAAAQQGMLPGVQDMMERMIGVYGPAFRDFVREMGYVIGDLFRQAGRMFTNPLWRDFFGMLAELGPTFMRQFGQAMMNWMSVFARLLTIAAPWAEKFSTALLGLSDSALAFMQSEKGTKAWTDFMGYVERVGPAVWDFFMNLWGAAKNLAIALAPLGLLILRAVDGILAFIANLDPQVLGAIVTAIMFAVIAFQMATGSIFLMAAAAELFAVTAAGTFANPFALAILAIMAVIGIVIILYTQFEWFRDGVHAVGRAIVTGWNAMVDGLVWAWENILKPMVDGIVAGFTWLWENVLGPIFSFIGKAFMGLARFSMWVWRNIYWPVIDLFMTAIGKLLWYGILKPIFGAIGRSWKDLGTAWGNVYETFIKPIIDAFMDHVGYMADGFGIAINNIRDLWGSLKQALAEPVRFFIETILNKGLIAGFNKIAEFVGSDPMSEIPMPNWTKSPRVGSRHGGRTRGVQEFATGGILPGYTPGKDVHHFVSPTGGRLHLSGGEAIMRPEVTAALGADWVNSTNAIARREGVNGLRKRMMGGAFARGGIIPAPGAWNQHLSGYPWATWAGDINVPGTADLGNPVKAYKEGIVAAVKELTTSYGKHVRVNHPDGSQTLYAHLSGINVHPGQKLTAGQILGLVGDTGNSSGPHLHFEIMNGHAPMGVGSDSGLPGWLEKIVGSPAAWFRDRIEGLFDRVADTPILGTLAKLPMKLIGGLVDKITALFGGDGHEGLGYQGDIPTGGVVDAVRSVASGYGWGGGDMWEALAEIVRRESSWDPNAINPTSSARGLFQKMTSIHGPVEGTAEAQALWGMQYIKSRYGNPMNALAHHNSEGWYADGGVVGGGSVSDNGTMMYDNGGYLPPGLTTVLNLTGKPEPVFTSDQWDRMGGGAGEGGGIHYEPHFEGSDLTAGDVADDLDFAFRSITRRGKYAGSR